VRRLVDSWRLAVVAAGAAALVPLALACGGGMGDDGSGDNKEPQLTRLADLADADAKGPGGGKFRETGFALYCRQNAGYEGSVFETIGFKPEGSQAKDEYCYNVSDDRLKVALSRRAASSGHGSCLVLTIAGGMATKSAVRSISSSDPCQP